jgi:hypothetical protein
MDVRGFEVSHEVYSKTQRSLDGTIMLKTAEDRYEYDSQTYAK